MLEPGAVVEHRQGPTARWFHERRVSLAIAVAILEGILIVADALSKPLALVVAIAVVVLYFTLADRLRPGVGREIAWIAAVSQAIVMLIPVLVILIGTLTLIGIAVIGVLALVLLFSRRG
jgi:hypothetical protein